MTEVRATISQTKVTGAVVQTQVAAEIARKVMIIGPAFSSAEIGDEANNKLVITFASNLNEAIVPATSAFSTAGITGSPSVSSVSISGVEVTLTLSGNANNGDTITVTYVVPNTNPLQDSDGMPTAAFTAESVSNNIVNPSVVVDGEFATACGVNWTCGAGWTITGGEGVASAAIGSIYQLAILTLGKSFKITFTITDYSAGTIRLLCGTGTIGTNRNGIGTYEETLLCSGNTGFYLQGGSNFIGKIDNVIAIEQ